MSPLILLIPATAVLMLMIAATVALLHVQGRRNRLVARIAGATQPHQRRSLMPTAAPTGGVGLAAEAAGFGHWLAGLFGFDPALQDHYLLRWQIALLMTFAMAAGAGRVATGLLGPLALLGIPLAWVFFSRRFFKWCEARRQERLFVQFPDALAMIVRSVRVGIPVSDAIRAVGREVASPTGPEFARLSDELSIGVVLDEALKVMAERNGLQEYRFFATALSLQSQTGGGLSETLDNLADVIRKRVAVRQRGLALSSEAKTSALVLGLLPPLAGIGLWVLNPAYITLLFSDPVGEEILAAAATALAGGVLTMRMMIRKSLS